MVVKKKTRKWRVYVDFTNLNKACQKDPFPLALDRSISGHYCRPSLDEFFGRLLGLSSDTISFGRSGKDCFSYTYWELLLQSNALQIKECRVYLPEDDDQDV